MDQAAWRDTVHGVAKNGTQLSSSTTTICIHVENGFKSVNSGGRKTTWKATIVIVKLKVSLEMGHVAKENSFKDFRDIKKAKLEGPDCMRKLGGKWCQS